MLEILARTRLPVEPVLPDELARKDDIGFLRGRTGITYTSGTHFDGPGLPTLQQFLDANVNGRAFAGGVNIQNTFTRTTAVTFRNIALQGNTLDITSTAQFGNNLTISGVTGAVRINNNRGTGLNFVGTGTVNIQNVTGSVTLTGTPTGPTPHVTAWNNVTLMSCRDARFDCGWDTEFRIATLLLQASAVVLQGQGTAKHQYTRTNIRFNSRLEIHSNLGPTSANPTKPLSDVNLGPVVDPIGDRHGFILDYRQPARPEETFARKDAIGASYGATAPTAPHVGMLWAKPNTGCADLSVWIGTEWLPICGGAPSVGPSTWDGGSTVWDGGATTWD